MNMKFDIRQMFQLGNRQLEGYKKNDKLINTTVLFLSEYLINKEPVSQKEQVSKRANWACRLTTKKEQVNMFNNMNGNYPTLV